MFWGLIMEPFKRYSQTVKTAFHISNAAIDVTTGDGEVCQVMVGSQGKDFLICTLQKGKNLQTPLDLYFKEGSEISFTTTGKCIVHLTGYLDPDTYEDVEEEDVEEEEEEDVPALAPVEKKRKAESPGEQKSKKQKKEQKKQAAKEESSDEDDDDSDGDLAKLLEDDDTDENDDSYLPNDTNDITMDDEDDDDEDDDDDDDEDDDDEDDEEEPAPVKKQEKKDKKDKGKPQQNGIPEKKNKKEQEQNKENEIKQNQQKVQDGAAKEKKVLPGNVTVEDIKVGQGNVAKPGKMLQVYYEGRLKSNNKMFDSCLKGPGFKFRLGKKEVITGWDVGLAGMKVGGKRRITCPPGMAYGKKGSPPVIPPNSTLVFEVELKGVN